jgi:outer membrane protein OmpA-like peptidoglycan-associated protein
VRVGSDQARIDGDLIHVTDGRDAVTVSGDWRRLGTPLVAAQARDVLIALGGVEEDGRIDLNLAGDILFGFDSSAIQTEAAAALDRVAQLIRARAAGAVQVIGHTDAKGDDAYNLQLSRDRAAAVMRYLNATAGIPADVMVGRGAGDRYPLAPNTHADGSDDPEGRARNRRVEIQMATREGITLGPGLVRLGAGHISTPEARIDATGITTDEARVDLNGGVVIDADDAPSAIAAPAGASGSCERFCSATAGRHDMNTIACIEGVMEELDHELDGDACDELEDAMALGAGNSGGQMCKACKAEAGFDEAECAAVLRRCF